MNLDLRLYQQTILGTASSANTLVVLPTGLGKTFIAAALAKLRVSEGKKMLFLAPTKPLAVQHQKTFSKILPHKSVVLTGAMPPEKRKDVWGDAQFIFATPQTIEYDLIAGRVRLDDVSLLVVDEAHRAVGDYAYVWVSKMYNQQASDRRILALSASPASEIEKLEEVRRNLFIDKVEVRSEASPDVAPYIQIKEIKKVDLEFPEAFIAIKNSLELALKSRLVSLHDAGLIDSADIGKVRKVELLKIQGMLAKEAGPGAFEVYKNISIVASCIKVLHCIELLETQGASPLVDFFRKLESQAKTVKAAKYLLEDWNIQKARALAVGVDVEHPKFAKLRDLVKENAGDRIIIFTQYRDTVDKILKEIKNIDNVDAVRFIGQKEGMSQKKQVETLEMFREGVVNVLVCTNIAEEGIDIPSVGVGIFFEPVPSALRSIQRAGRIGRTNVGKVYVLVTKGTIDEKYYWVARHKANRMKTILDSFNKEVGQTALS